MGGGGDVFKKVFGSIPVVGDIVQGIGAEEAGEDAAKQAEREADESRRRLARQQQANLGEARARVGASGIKLGGSTAGFINDLSRNYAAELDWIRESGASAAAAERRRGELAGMAAYGRAFSNALGLATATKQLGWWGTGNGS